ncbi:MAG: hypothetical protein ACD_50C00323G0001, partial [uncultured bacterium]
MQIFRQTKIKIKNNKNPAFVDHFSGHESLRHVVKVLLYDIIT